MSEQGTGATITDEKDTTAVEVEAFRAGGWFGWAEGRPRYQLTRFAFLRMMGLVYFVAFASLWAQVLPLVGHDGLLPAHRLLEDGAAAIGSRASGFAEVPTLFWFGASDFALQAWCAVGLVLSALLLIGVTNAVVQLALWFIYMSFVHVGQVFFGFGWELQTLETGFISIFLCPLRSIRPFPVHAPPVIPIWALRWLTFRLMLGAGLIKLRGAGCWTDLSCLDHHYETQPLPHFLSPIWHAMPGWSHSAGVLFNHFVELLVPFALFGPRRFRLAGGALVVAFQAILILSGNLSFLNWLSITAAIGCFDDGAFARILPRRWRARATQLSDAEPASRRSLITSYVFGAVVAILSIQPTYNLMRRRQIMNTSFERLHLVNTYGAFGSVNEIRYEIILQGTSDVTLTPDTEWRDFELPCKPGDVRRRPCWSTPYHHRLDWQMWFLPGTHVRHSPWFLNLTYKLLLGEPTVKQLLAQDPFPDEPPRFVRAEVYRYEFSDEPGVWWQRTREDRFLRPVSVDDVELVEFLRARHLLGEPSR